MDPRLQSLMARRMALMEDIDDDACYREGANARSEAQAAPKARVRGGQAVPAPVVTQPAAAVAVADIDMDEHEPEPAFGAPESPEHSAGPPAQPARPTTSMRLLADYKEVRQPQSAQTQHTSHAPPPSLYTDAPAGPPSLQPWQESRTTRSPLSVGHASNSGASVSPLSNPSPKSYAPSPKEAPSAGRAGAEAALLKFTESSRSLSVQRNATHTATDASTGRRLDETYPGKDNPSLSPQVCFVQKVSTCAARHDVTK